MARTFKNELAWAEGSVISTVPLWSENFVGVAKSLARSAALLEKYRGIERVREKAQAFTNKARQIIGEFPESPYQRALLRVTELVTERDL